LIGITNLIIHSTAALHKLADLLVLAAFLTLERSWVVCSPLFPGANLKT